ncbi:DedA family protein [Treponema pectinovorum]|uniref:DedA family protein n=1 Tax=Treponema pectinovorum TaxID=164 RepID=UPI0011C9CEBF|nr:VTT domain-containing protein [Treponema pectinovorum]
MFDALMNFFTAYFHYWPVTCFILLLFAGLNFPIPEDAVIIISAGIAAADHSLLIPNWGALYAGIFISDIMSYFLGKLVSKGMFQFKAIRKKLTPKRLRFVSKTLDDYGFRTFIVCRFIPFGVRNTLFMGSGFVGLPFKKFVLYDSIAAIISCSTLYFLMIFMGAKASLVYKVVGVILFVSLVASFAILIVKVLKREAMEFRKEDEEKENK